MRCVAPIAVALSFVTVGVLLAQSGQLRPVGTPEGYEHPAVVSQSPLIEAVQYALGGCCSLVWTLFVVAILLAAGRRYIWFPWFWEIAAIRWIADAVDTAWARLAGRRELERELRARTHNPRDSKARYNLGVIYMRQRRWSAAAEELRLSVEVNPDRVDAYYRLAQCLIELDQRDEALEPLQACIERREDHLDAPLLLSRCLIELDRSEEARPVLERFLERHPDDVEAWYRLGLVEALAGRMDAVRRLEGAIERARHSARPNRRRDHRLAAAARRKLVELRRENR